MIHPPKPLTSPTPQSAWLDRLRQRTKQLRPAFGLGSRIASTTRGFSYTSTDVSDGGGSIIKTFKIISIHDNDLLCYEFDGATTGTTQHLVARPWTQRRYVYEAATGSVTYTWVDAQERTATDGSTTETHRIVKRYEVDEMIVAVKHRTWHNQEYWVWLELNMDGRDWARVT